MRRLVFETVLFFGFVNFSLLLHAQGSVTLEVCNTGTVEIDAIFSGAGQVFNEKIRPASCAAIAKSEGGGMESGYLGLAFTDSRGQYGAARRFDGVPYMGVKDLPAVTKLAMKVRGEPVPDPLSVLSLATGKTIQYRNVSVPLQLLFQPRVPECISTGTTVPDQGRIYVGGTYCEELVYTLTVEAYPDTREIRLSGLPVGGAMSANPPYRFSEKTAVNWAKEEAARKEREGQPVNWSDLEPALRSVRYPRPTILDVLPRYIVIRGTVSSVEVDDSTQYAEVTFREAPSVPNYTRFKMCTKRLDILQERFGADFRTSMVGKPIEVRGSPGGDCNREQGMNILLAHHVRPVSSALFAADVRVWVPAPVEVKPPPPPPSAEGLAASIVHGAKVMGADLQFREQGRMRAACAEQNDKAYKANPGNLDAINKEYFACKQAADSYTDPILRVLRDAAPAEPAVPLPSGQQYSAAASVEYMKAAQEQRDRATQERMAAEQRLADKAKPCAQELSNAYPDGGLSDPEGYQKGFQACVQTLRASVSSAPVPAAVPIPAPAAPVAAPAQPTPPARTATAPAPAAAPRPTVDPATEAVARAKALQEQQQRAAQERAATQQRLAQEAQQKAQQIQACMQQVMKDYPDDRRTDPGFQRAIVGCSQIAQQAQPAK